jgi:alpha-ketoglutarate-dependent taurine dioxygenase
MAVRFEDLKPLVGSKVVWDDRADLFTQEAADAVRAKVEERTVVVFPRLHLTDDEQLRITDLMGGRLNFNNTKVTGNATENDVYKVTLDKKVNPQSEYVLGTFFWHMDGITVDIAPPFASLLSARKIAPKGGQTEFASTYAAYEGLSDTEKRELGGLRAVHSVKAALSPIADAIPPEDVKRVTEIGLVKEHPLVWTHQSGRKSMIIGTQADHVVGMTIPEGRALLIRLQEWAAQPDFSYRHEWEVGDFVIWDNTGAMHRVLPYAVDSGRMMHRTSLAGHEEVM